jgi:hypothetical protein
MGRYYSGDIEGKFMFAVQSSTAADRFGATYSEPTYVDYYFDEEQLETIKEQLDILRPSYEKVRDWFDVKSSYTKEEQIEQGVTDEDMSDYADYILGEKILNCVLENGECNFTAEL